MYSVSRLVCQGQYRNRYRQGCLVDRVRQYASRFAPAVAGTAKLAAERIAGRLARIAASQLNTEVDDIVFAAARSDRNAIPTIKYRFPVWGLSPLVAGRAA